MRKAQTNPTLRYIRGLAQATEDTRVADRELLVRIAERDETATAALVRRHGAMVLGVCLRVLRHQQDAEDAFQATFVALARAAASLRPQESVGGWLHSVAYRTAQKMRVAAARRRKHEERAADRVPADPFDQLTVREANEVLDAELARLPDKFRVPLVLCYLEGLTRDEAAARLGWLESTLKSRLEQARERLGARLSARGLTLSGVLVAALFTGGSATAVTPALMASTVGAATAQVGTHSSAVSAPISALAEGVKTMSATKLKIVTTVLLGIAALGTWAGIGLSSATPEAPVQRAAEDAPKPDSPAPEKGAGNDLAKIERTIAKEPKYTSKTPKYCLLVFGPDAKTRVWLVHDGDNLYVDRNGNGDLTEENDRVVATNDPVRFDDASEKNETRTGTLLLKAPFKLGTITERDGKTKHTLWVVYAEKGEGTSEQYSVWAEIDRKYIQMTDLGFCFGDRPKDAPIVHLNGSLALHSWVPDSALPRGDKPGQLTVRVGTPGVGEYTEAWLNPFRGVPDDIHPIADIEFPNKQPGGKSIKVQIPLTKRGAGNCLFFDELPVPDDAGEGKAKVTVHFKDWRGAQVKPLTFEVPIGPLKKP
ncbi:RNA polymerase sigma factor [Gemmata sp. G18]|uniref:RNA polymerase sigma factor n=1 Tax=Gemmata palustris TaxID=2822762 RepID=A0ABS5C1W0_9BACT|nr:RNA polymerase sigma factor [Gemmata palustris]MBP3959850.1 RNA polymerase sigma factor [Gemmata palustris]